MARWWTGWKKSVMSSTKSKPRKHFMPHVIVKLWPGKSEAQKTRLAERITQDVMESLNYGEEAVSVALEEIQPPDWKDKVYRPDILEHPERLYKKPGYTM